jgi:adenylate cyclase
MFEFRKPGGPLSDIFVCALTTLGEYDAALDRLATVIDKVSQGWPVWLVNDTDLDPLRDHPRFIELARNAKARLAAG